MDQNHFHHRILLLLSFLMAIAAGGCAPTAIKHLSAIPSPPPGSYQEIFVGEFKTEKLSAEANRRLVRAIQRKLQEEGVFRSVSLASGEPIRKPSTVTLTGTITELTEGSRALQLFIGFGAGASEAAGSFELIGPEAKPLLQFSASTTYKGGLGIGGGAFLSAEDLLDRLGASVAEQVAKWARGEKLD